jgi:hypothetical protein
MIAAGLLTSPNGRVATEFTISGRNVPRLATDR